VFWVVDNGSSHRGQASIDRLQGAFCNLVLIHLPVHASWLNQIELYFSAVQRKVLTPNDFTDLAEVEARLLDFQDHYERIARPFEWKFTRADLGALLAKLQRQSSPSTTEAA
jgi:DDE superfamily endonuclease